MKFKYKVVEISPLYGRDQIESKINSLAKDGWEFVNLYGNLFIFKKVENA